MAKLKKATVFNAHVPKAETPMEKTTRVVREMVNEEAEQRQIKNARLRKTRLERDANTPSDACSPKPVKKR
ncbi:hypothetical protein [Ruegeria sp. A3M17]|uniref:hypothetical protein n=1 Tax=Ruegeria sp. A3M17 TaxID=2267229 RepID=UPI000DE9C1A4|nr:hypothetical protein [Ruegeria sp. A3M17]RBW60433.1 hypothetical protein DS906_06415 [Ruegeria sp. A3M17]